MEGCGFAEIESEIEIKTKIIIIITINIPSVMFFFLNRDFYNHLLSYFITSHLISIMDSPYFIRKCTSSMDLFLIERERKKERKMIVSYDVPVAHICV